MRFYNPESHQEEVSHVKLSGKEPSPDVSKALAVTLDLNIQTGCACRDGSSWPLQLHSWKRGSGTGGLAAPPPPKQQLHKEEKKTQQKFRNTQSLYRR